MKHASLFSGIGGFDLAADWMGWENVFHCEINPFCQKILKYYWPNAQTYDNIKTTNFTIWRDRIDILTGGFPCQPYSSAGKRLGKEDDRHLWPEMLRAIREIKPRWIVGENVAGLLTWNDGLVFREVCADLEDAGYEVQAFIIPACSVGAPHRRDRVWIIAYANNTRNITQKRRIYRARQAKIKKSKDFTFDKFARFSILRTIANAEMPRGKGKRKPKPEQGEFNRRDSGEIRPNFDKFPTQSPICGGNDGLSRELDGITFPKWRGESIKGYGNAVVPQVVYKIFQAISKIP